MIREMEKCTYCNRTLTLDPRYLDYLGYALRHRINKGHGKFNLSDVCQDCYEGVPIKDMVSDRSTSQDERKAS